MAFPDDDPESKFPADDPDLLKNRSIPQRALVISAGVLANIIFAYSLLFTQASSRALSHPPCASLSSALSPIVTSLGYCIPSHDVCHADSFSLYW